MADGFTFKSSDWNMEEFKRIRKSEGMVAELKERGEDWVKRLNDELHEAQAKRKQPIEDGYGYFISTRGTRARLDIVAESARAQAHEAVHQSILKLMVMGEVAKAGGSIADADVPRELAERVKRHKAAEKKRARKRAKAAAKQAARLHDEARGFADPSRVQNLDNPDA